MITAGGFWTSSMTNYLAFRDEARASSLVRAIVPCTRAGRNAPAKSRCRKPLRRALRIEAGHSTRARVPGRCKCLHRGQRKRRAFHRTGRPAGGSKSRNPSPSPHRRSELDATAIALGDWTRGNMERQPAETLCGNANKTGWNIESEMDGFCQLRGGFLIGDASAL
jgi:hypothetical protein